VFFDGRKARAGSEVFNNVARERPSARPEFDHSRGVVEPGRGHHLASQGGRGRPHGADRGRGSEERLEKSERHARRVVAVISARNPKEDFEMVSGMAFVMFRGMKHGFVALLLAAMSAQGGVVDNTGKVENPKPTWETQRQARTFSLLIPAPRGQITDRNGLPLAQTRLSYNLAITFPTPLDWTDEKILSFARRQIALASATINRDIRVSDSAILNHYKNRGVLPMDIAEDLLPQEMNAFTKAAPPNQVLRQTYVRFYPNGPLAAHIIGYTGPKAPLSQRPIENNDLIFPESEGREGLEQIFDKELRGTPGLLQITFDADGKKSSAFPASRCRDTIS
jgi:hypothetical protein